ISCPCALALATPAALTSAANALRHAGVIVRGENALEALARTTHLIFDKTGTLTEGSLQISTVQPLAGAKEAELLAIAAALQQYSSHPVSRAFSDISPAPGWEQVDYRVGAGLEGRRPDGNYRMGSEQCCRQWAPALPPPPDQRRYWIALCREAT
ncbi:MAG: HAD family hydrolase, partial [Ottowia sp.]|nr:HAD family hydrolase [Ottowia sp.]